MLLRHDATLNMTDADAASRACQAVFDGNMVTLRRLFKAGHQVNAGDYDQRRPIHVAAAEGSVAAVKLLLEFGADVTVKDRWGNTAADEARRVGAGQVLEYLTKLEKTTPSPTEAITPNPTE
jgi:ankyrin repeat protein